MSSFTGPSSLLLQPGLIPIESMEYANWITPVDVSTSFDYQLPSADEILLKYGCNPYSGLQVKPNDVWKRFLINQRAGKVNILPGAGGTGGSGCQNNTQANCMTMICIMWLTASKSGNDPPTGTYTVFGGDVVAVSNRIVLNVKSTDIKVNTASSKPIQATPPASPEVLSQMGAFSLVEDYDLVERPLKDKKLDIDVKSKD